MTSAGRDELKHCTWILHHSNPYGSAPPLSLQMCNLTAMPRLSPPFMPPNMTPLFCATCEALSYSFDSNGDSPTDTSVANSSVAFVLQRIITLLAISGVSVVVSHKPLEKCRVKENILVVNKTVASHHVGDPWQSMRCAFWQQADYIQSESNKCFVRVICNQLFELRFASNFEAATMFTASGLFSDIDTGVD